MVVPIRVGGSIAYTVLASAPRDFPSGGVFALGTNGFEQIDWIASKGLYVAGDRLLRVVGFGAPPTELFVYDTKGIVSYLRLDTVSHVHDVAWNGQHVLVVSTGSNRILWLDADGSVAREWYPGGEDNSWHVNCLFVCPEGIFASAFGRYSSRYEWRGRQGTNAGVLFKIDTGEDVLTGLDGPHSPRMIDGQWVICNSRKSEVWFADASTGDVEPVTLRKFTRGIAFTDDYILVGESAARRVEGPDVGSSVAVLDRTTHTLVTRVRVPTPEIYDLVVVPTALADGVRRGFRTGSGQVDTQDQLALLRQAGVPVLSIRVAADLLGRISRRLRRA